MISNLDTTYFPLKVTSLLSSENFSQEDKEHLENQFKEGMTWHNRSEWHIDHIVPLSSANNEEELYKLCHYTNLQPLWAEENLKKSNKIL